MDDDADRSSSSPATDIRERAHLFRHQMFFVVGLVLGVIGVATSHANSRLAGATLGVAAVCLIVSAGSAIAAGRHLFGSVRYGGLGSNVTTPSGRDRTSATIVALVIAVISVLLAMQATHLLFG